MNPPATAHAARTPHGARGPRLPFLALLLSSALTLACLGLLEGALALLDLPPQGLLEGDPGYLWWLRPGIEHEQPFPQEGRTFRVHINPHGWRGRPLPETGAFTLALGCSTTFGWGVEDGETWPAQLELLLNEPVVNGGIPGFSTHQAVLGLERLGQLRAARVILAYLVRDSQQAPRPDRASRPSPWLFQTRLLRLLLQVRGALEESATPGRLWPDEPSQARVPPAELTANLIRLKAAWPNAEVLLLAFPQLEPPRPWIEAMRKAGRTLEPTLERDAFFPHDPVHLTAAGHRALAEQVAATLRQGR